MADQNASVASLGNIKWHDNGDGSFSLTVYDAQLVDVITNLASLATKLDTANTNLAAILDHLQNGTTSVSIL